VHELEALAELQANEIDSPIEPLTRVRTNLDREHDTDHSNDPKKLPIQASESCASVIAG
jgi:hypothetical protein